MRIKFIVLVSILIFSLKVSATEFKIQLAAFVEKAPFTYFVFAGINDVYMNIDQNNIYRYYLRQSYFNLEEAEQVRELLVCRGFLNALVVDVEKQMSLCGKPCPYATPTTTFSSDETELLQMKTIFFGFDKSSLDLESQKKLDILYKTLLENKELKVKILGHTDSKGSAEYNIALSKRRVRAARSYLISKGIPAFRINAIVFGESAPLRSNIDQEGEDSPEGRRFNRRIVVALYNPKGEIVSSETKDKDETTSKTAPPQLLRVQPK